MHPHREHRQRDVCEGLGYTDFNTYLAIPQIAFQRLRDKRKQLLFL